MSTPQEVELHIEESIEVRDHLIPVLSCVRPAVLFDFWERLIENNRAMLLLIRSGFISEAMAVQRLSIEHFAYMVAILKKTVTEQQLQQASQSVLPKMMKFLLRDDDSYSTLTKENRESAESFVRRSEANPIKDPGLSVFNLLSENNLKYIYQGPYRMLSMCAAHSTFLSAIRNKMNPHYAENDVEYMCTTAVDLLRLSMAHAKDAAKQLDQPPAA